MRRYCILWSLALAMATAAVGQEIRVALQLGPGSAITPDQVAILTVQIDGTDGRQARPDVDFELENLRVVSGPSTAKSLRFQDGNSSHSLTLTWHLRPQGLGTARVYGASLRLGTRRIRLPEDHLEIVEDTSTSDAIVPRDPFTPSAPPNDEDSDDSPVNRFRQSLSTRSARPLAAPTIFLQAEAEPKNPYVGQQVLYTLYLYTQADVRSVNPEQLPAFKGFWSRVVPQPDQLRPKMIYRRGERIGRVILLQRALFPRRAGRFVIEPVEARLAALMPDTSPFGSALPRTREILRASEAVTVDVRELPPSPPGFQGAVGQIEISAELTPPELQVGDAATLAITLSGRGHFQGLPPPKLGELSGFRVFPPQQQSNESVREKGVSGERTWSFVLIPEQAGSQQLPTIEIPYFDPEQARYLTASAILPTLDVEASTRLIRGDGQTLELRPIRTAALPAASTGGWTAMRTWLFGVPWFLTAALLLLRRRNSGRTSQPRQRLLRRLQDAADQRQPRRAAVAIEEAWSEFLHDHWQLAEATPSAQWGDQIASRGARRAAVDQLVALAEDLHYLRYAPKLSSTEDLQRDLAERSRKLARQLS